MATALQVSLWRRFPTKYLGRPNASDELSPVIVLGEFDHMEAQEIRAFSDIFKEDSLSQLALSSPDVDPVLAAVHRGFSSDVSLFPIAESSWLGAPFRMDTWCGKQTSEWAVCIINCFSVSPVLFRIYPEVLAAELVDAAACGVLDTFRNQLPDASEISVAAYKSLSAPHFVVVCALKRESQIPAIHKAVLSSSQCLLSEFVHTFSKNAAVPDPTGHLLSSLRPIIAFRQDAISLALPHNANDEAMEPPAHLELLVRATTECGHACDVVAQLLAAGQDENGSDLDNGQFAIDFGGQQISIRCRNLREYATLWKRFFSKAKWLEANLTDLSTTVSMLADHGTNRNHPPEWAISNEMRVRVEEILKAIGTISPFLGNRLFTALDEVCKAFLRSFFSAELIVSSLDLFVFFEQLGVACTQLSSIENEVRKLDWPINGYVNNLVGFARRALRNRIEHRAIRNDPNLASRLELSAVNLISAYSFLFEYCVWVHDRRRKGIANSCSQKFEPIRTGVCVSAGRDGRVTVVEPFERVRRVLHQHGTSFPALFCVDLSGHCLQHPRGAFALMAHEASELTDWVASAGQEVIRFAINEAILVDVSTRITKQIVGLIDVDDNVAMEFVVSQMCWLTTAMDYAENKPADGDVQDPPYAILHSACATVDPIAFLDRLTNLLLSRTIDPEGDVGKALTKRFVHEFAPLVRNSETADALHNSFEEISRSGILVAILDSTKTQWNERVADLGMLNLLAHIWHTESTDERIPDRLSAEDVDGVFGEFVDAALEGYGTGGVGIKMVAYRWAFCRSIMGVSTDAICVSLSGFNHDRPARIPKTLLEELQVELKETDYSHFSGRMRQLLTNENVFCSGVGSLEFQPEEADDWRTARCIVRAIKEKSLESDVELVFHLWSRSVAVNRSDILGANANLLVPARTLNNQV